MVEQKDYKHTTGGASEQSATKDQDHEVSISENAIKRSYNSNQRQHKTDSAKWNKCIAVAAILYTIFTFLILLGSLYSAYQSRRAADAARAQAATSDDTERRQLRAYVFPDGVTVYNVDGDITKILKKPPNLEVQIKNTGNTPAYDVTVFTGGTYRQFPARFKVSDVSTPITVYANKSVFIMPSGATEHAFSDVNGATIPLTARQKQSMDDGVSAIYFFGEIIYHDAFGILRCNTFKYYVGGNAGFDGNAMKNAGEGQEADTDCHQPKARPIFILPPVPHYGLK